jgi:ribosome-binding protein aMBF1 (putative translation factor)
VKATPTIATVTNRGNRAKPGGPAAYITAGTWPDGTTAADAPHAIRWAIEISSRLKAALSKTSTTAVAAELGVARSTLYDIVNGTTWPDLVTIADLEVVLDIELLPRSRRHRHQ